MGVTRFPHGISTTSGKDVLRDLGVPDPTKWFCYYNDFHTTKDYDSTNQFIATAYGGSASVATTGEFGEIVLSSGSAAGYNIFLQLRGNNFTMRTGKKAMFKARLKLNTTDNATAFIGLQIQDTTPLDYTDGILFMKSNTATAFTAQCRKNATTGATEVANVCSIANDTYMVLGFYFNGKNAVEYYCDGVKLTTIDSTNYLPDDPLTISFGVQTGNAVNKILTVDYVFAAVER